ncbi:MAG: pyruvate kinase [Acidobacteriota bacterium]|nr:pyruvate kinase [Acidobacteriota bacterium]
MRIDVNPEVLLYRRTKIVATLGPSSSDPRVIAELVRAGVDVFRLNFSHGTHDEHREIYERVRAATAEAAPATAVLADLCGPKIRVGSLASGSITLVDGDEVTVTTRAVEGGPGLVPTQYEALADDVRAGDRILLDDGNLELRVEGVAGSEIACRVVTGGVLKSRKGMNLPGVGVSAPALTAKDRRDAAFALALGVDFLALSFVRRGADVLALRELVDGAGARAAIIAKIEKPEALEDIDSIVDAADGLMVARGDLGVELPPQAVPLAQDQLVDLGRQRGKPVIVATQMLESMIEHPRPTRAEVSDVANAVRSGADAVMLSGETAAGAYPVKTVETMDDVIRRTEQYLWSRRAFVSSRRPEAVATPIPVEDALAISSAQLSRDLRVRAILVLSTSGRSVAVVSSARPLAPIVAVLHDAAASRRANLIWGSIPLAIAGGALEDPQALARRLLADLGLAETGQAFLVVRGFSPDSQKSFPSISIGRV